MWRFPRLALGFVLLTVLGSTPLGLACGSEGLATPAPTSAPSPTPASTAPDTSEADLLMIAREYGRTVFNEQYALDTWQQAPEVAYDSYMEKLHDPLNALADVTGVAKYREAAALIEDLAALISAAGAYNYNQLIFHSGSTYDLRWAFEELADLTEEGEDHSKKHARLRSELVRLRAHVESYFSEQLQGSDEMKRDARAAARSAVESAASFLDGLAETQATAGAS